MDCRHRRPCVITTLALCWLALASPAAAQSMLGGVVRDPTGQVAGNVTVIAENEETGETSETLSSSLGVYAFNRLRDGTYTIRVSLPPLSFVKHGVDVRPRQKAALDIPLCVCREERLTVRSGDAQPRPLLGGVGGAIVSRGPIETMSMSNGRTLQSILATIPGIVFTESVGTLAQFTAGGQRRHSNRLTIDGISADLAVDTAGPGIGLGGSGGLPATGTLGTTQTLIPLAAIDEVQIRTVNAVPEHARATGARTVVLTRAGSSRTTARAFVDGRPDRFAARDWFQNASRAPQRRTDSLNYGISGGGPLWPERINFFAAAERQQIKRPLFTTIPVPSAEVRQSAPATVRPLLDAYPLPNGGGVGHHLAELSRWFPVDSQLSTVSLRVDAELSTRHRLFARANYGRSAGDELAPEPAPLQPRLVFTHREHTDTSTATVGLTSLWSASANELRASVSSHQGGVDATRASDDGAQELPVDLLAQASDAWVLVDLYPATHSTLISGRTASNAHVQLQFGDTLSLARGRHQWRLGFDHAQTTSSADAAPDRYSYSFSGIADLLEGRVRQVLVTHFAAAKARRQSWAFFVQDTMHASPRLALHYGVRYTIQPAPVSLNATEPALVRFEVLPTFQKRDNGALWNTSKRLSPQVSASYQLATTEGRATTINGGWSLNADELTSPGMLPFGRGASYSSTRRIGATSFPLAPATFAGGVALPGEYFAFPASLRTPTIQQWHASIDQTLGRSQRVSVGYAGTTGHDLIYWHAYTIPSARAFVHAFSNDGASEYHALIAQYTRRLSRRWQATVGYVWSHAIDNDSGESLQPLPPPSVVAPALNRGSADFDRRHVLQIGGTYHLPREWQVDVTARVQSGAPIDVTVNRELGVGTFRVRPDVVSGASLWIDDPTGPTGQLINEAAFSVPNQARQGTLGRNSFRAPPLRQVDLALSKTFTFG
jgi:hypothetical protein